jgi:hypothetical protein
MPAGPLREQHEVGRGNQRGAFENSLIDLDPHACWTVTDSLSRDCGRGRNVGLENDHPAPVAFWSTGGRVSRDRWRAHRAGGVWGRVSTAFCCLIDSPYRYAVPRSPGCDPRPQAEPGGPRAPRRGRQQHQSGTRAAPRPES